MRTRVSSPGTDLSEHEVDRIRKDLEKLDRRLSGWREVDAEVRVNSDGNQSNVNVVIEVHYGRNHLIAKGNASDAGLAVRDARDDILRQINDRSRRGHSSFSKGR